VLEKTVGHLSVRAATPKTPSMKTRSSTKMRSSLDGMIAYVTAHSRPEIVMLIQYMYDEMPHHQLQSRAEPRVALSSRRRSRMSWIASYARHIVKKRLAK
jgi:hypothetical protein